MDLIKQHAVCLDLGRKFQYKLLFYGRLADELRTS